MKINACMYLRLSREDGDSNESNSISNQRQLINTFANANNLTIVKEYVDDGFSGTNFDRPSFKKMLNDLDDGYFNTIIVKDLSRFGRDYIESGKYLQKIFPEKGVRFISVNDNYDSESADVSDTHLILPIRNFINDSYARDISMKVKSSKEIKRKNGEYLGSFAPFGYKKSLKDNHKLVIDEEVSHIIKRIFNMKVEGYSSNAIAKFLNSIGAITPIKHKENKGINFAGFVSKNSKWDTKMINRIITNRVYIGILEQGKTTKLNYKSKKEVKKLEDDWIVKYNAHSKIVNKSTFEIANKMLLRDLKKSSDKPSILSGMLYCKDCGSPMVKRKIRGKDGFYICSLYNKGGCTRHSIKEEYILKMLGLVLKDYLSKHNELLEKVNLLDTENISFEVDFENLKTEKQKYERLRQSLYMDLEEELITTDEFEKFRKTYLVKIREIEKQIITKKEIAKELKEKLSDKSSLVLEIIPNDLDNINRLSLVSFVDKIEIGEDSKLNFVFNNIETINLLKAILDNQKNKENTKDNKLISVHNLFINKITEEKQYAFGGGF